MEVVASLTGFFPRPEALVAATRDLDRGRATPEAVEALTRSTEREIIGLERRNGLAPLTGGYLRWQDIFRPLAERWGGFTVGPVTRWFETNTFFRQPVLHHPPERAPGALADVFPGPAAGLGPAEAQILLPGPYTLAGVLENRSGETHEALVHRLGRLLAEEIAELRGRGYRSFLLEEPLLVVRPPRGPAAESVLAAYRAIGGGANGGDTIVWTFFGDAAPVFPLLGRLPVSVIGIDLSETELARLPVPDAPIGIGLGCLDPRTTLREDPEQIRALAQEARERLRPPRLWLGPGGPLDLLPYEAARRKLEILPLARSMVDGGPR